MVVYRAPSPNLATPHGYLQSGASLVEVEVEAEWWSGGVWTALTPGHTQRLQ